MDLFDAILDAFGVSLDGAGSLTRDDLAIGDRVEILPGAPTAPAAIGQVGEIVALDSPFPGAVIVGGLTGVTSAFGEGMQGVRPVDLKKAVE